MKRVEENFQYLVVAMFAILCISALSLSMSMPMKLPVRAVDLEINILFQSSRDANRPTPSWQSNNESLLIQRII